MMVRMFPSGFPWAVSLLAVLTCASDTLHATERTNATTLDPVTTGMETAGKDRNTSDDAPGNIDSLTNKTLVPLPPFIVHNMSQEPVMTPDMDGLMVFNQPDPTQYIWDKQRTSAELYLTGFGLSVCTRNASTSTVMCPSPRGYECECGEGCENYGSCCHDRLPDLTVPSFAGCLESGSYAISKCPAEWSQASVVDMCEKGNGQYTNDEPVTHLTTNITFRNEFCAACHGVSSYTSWELKVTCDHFQSLYTADTQDAFMDLVMQNRDICAVERVPPAEVETHKCPAKWWFYVPFINTCNVTGKWKDEDYDSDVVFNCALYKSLVLQIQDRGRVFQNLFCAICNGVHPRVEICGYEVSVTRAPGPALGIAPLSLLLGLHDGHVQGEVYQGRGHLACLPGQWFDLKVSRCSLHSSLSLWPLAPSRGQCRSLLHTR